VSDEVTSVLSDRLILEIEEIMMGEMPEPGREVQLFGYFPLLKMQTLFGSLLIHGDLPRNVTPLGPTRLLEIPPDDLPPQKTHYLYVVIREPTVEGIRYTYVFPVEEDGFSGNDLEMVHLTADGGTDELLEIESRIREYAMNCGQADVE